MALSVLLTVLAVVVTSTVASAAAKPVAVGVFEGPFGEDVRQKAVDSINKDGQLSVVKDKPSDRVDMNETKGTYEDAAQKLGVAGILTGHVSNRNDQWAVLLAVYGSNGELVQKFRMRGETADVLNEKIAKLLPKHLAQLLEEFQPPPKEKPKPKPKPKPKAAAAPVAKPARKEEPTKAESKPDDKGDTTGALEVTLEEEETPPEDDEEEDDASAGPLPSPLEVHFGFGYASRSFSYEGSVTPNLDISNAGLSWATTLRFYPGAIAYSDILGHLGLELTLEQGFPNELEAAVTGPDGSPLNLKFQAETARFFIGPRARIPLGEHEVGLVAGYGTHRYYVHGDENLDVIDPEGQIDPCFLNSNLERTDVPADGSCVVPDVHYKYMRFGADARFIFGKIVLGLRAGYRLLLSAGEIEEPYWFSGVSGGGLEAGLMGGYQLSSGMLGVVGFDYYAYNLKFDAATPERAAQMVGGPLATGAKDTYIQIWLGLQIIVPGLN